MDQPRTLAQLVDDGSDESELLARYQQHNDADAFAAIYFRHVDDLRAYGRRLLGRARASEIEDMIQEAITCFIANRMRYAPEECARRLLFKILDNVCADHHRHVEAEKRDHRRTRRLLPSDADRKADPTRLEEKLDAKTKVDSLLGTVAPAQAEAIRLTKIDGHTAESAAELLGTTTKAVNNRIGRGMEAMKKAATTSLILFALIGVVFDNCDLDLASGMVTTEADEDEVAHEDGAGHHQVNKLCRKNLMRLPLRSIPPEVSMAEVVNARNSEYDVLIARPSKWGNPFVIGRDGTRDQVIRMYEVHVRRRPDLLAALPELAGKRLDCYCKPESCHGDVLVKLLKEFSSEGELHACCDM